MSDTWRLIDTGVHSASHNMALDEAISASVRHHDAPPTLRIYGWEKPSVSIGCFQKSRDIDVTYCREKKIPIVRRPTGGRAVFHNNEITYSFSAKTKTGLFSGGLFDSYKKISCALGLALAKIGLSPEITTRKKFPESGIQEPRPYSPLCFQSVSYGEVSVGTKKLIGSAQKRWADGFLQQGSIPLMKESPETVKKVFGATYPQDEKNSSICLEELIPDLSCERVKEAIRVSFEEIFNVEFDISTLSEEEHSLAQELEVQKYLSDEWTFGR
jgi:lipoate-protein ligase A